MNKLLETAIKFAGNIIGINKEGFKSNGLISIIKDAPAPDSPIGKISFRRSTAIIVLTTIVAPDVIKNGLTWMNVALTGLCIFATTFDSIIKK